MNAPVAEFLAAAKTSLPPAALPTTLAQPVPVTVAYGDGIGPEIMKATLAILGAAGARLALEPVEIGAKVYQRGIRRGSSPRSWASLRRTRSAQGADHHAAGHGIQEPQRHAAQDPRAVRQRASLRRVSPVRRHPASGHGRRDRPRERGRPLRRHRAPADGDIVQCLKLVTRPGTESIVRYAFEFARAHGRKKVTCMTKDNIMKLTDGLFSSTFRRDRRRESGPRDRST